VLVRQALHHQCQLLLTPAGWLQGLRLMQQDLQLLMTVVLVQHHCGLPRLAAAAAAAAGLPAAAVGLPAAAAAAALTPAAPLPAAAASRVLP
jgi:hypothetical protein